MNLRVVDWNICGKRNVERQISWLREDQWDVALLQEVTNDKHNDSFAQLQEALDATGVAAFEHLSNRVLHAKGLTYFCAVFVRGWDIEASRVLPVPSPERSLVATIRKGDIQIDVASLALPPARKAWGKPAKNRQAVVFAGWAEQRTRPTIFGIDGNTPEVDHPDHARSQFFQVNEPWLLGPPPPDHEPADDRHAVHDLRDTYRTWLAQSPAELEQIQRERPDGPLYVTHENQGRPRRYDSIWASPEFEVLDAGHVYDHGHKNTHGSDHGIVWCDLRLNT